MAIISSPSNFSSGRQKLFQLLLIGFDLQALGIGLVFLSNIIRKEWCATVSGLADSDKLIQALHKMWEQGDENGDGFPAGINK